MGSAWLDRPQRRTALVGRGLGRYGIEIAALSENRFAEVDPGPRHTSVFNNSTSCSPFSIRIFKVGLGLVSLVSA